MNRTKYTIEKSVCLHFAGDRAESIVQRAMNIANIPSKQVNMRTMCFQKFELEQLVESLELVERGMEGISSKSDVKRVRELISKAMGEL